ncbi:MAG: N-acetylglutaminylglutamine synthetase [Opitutales bacterium]
MSLEDSLPETTASGGVVVPCGWGRLIFAHTFPDPESVAGTMLQEAPGQRDIAFYLNDPHIVLNHAPQKLFLDPSHTFRLDFADYEPAEDKGSQPFVIDRLRTRQDLEEINRIYQSHGMVPVDADYVWAHREADAFTYFTARNRDSGALLGVAMGVDHMANFNDLENGCSLWALAVDGQAEFPGIGQAVVRYMIEYYQQRGRERMDLSVMAENEHAIRLYEKLNFRRIAVFALKTRNEINEKLFTGQKVDAGYNPYAAIIINEALRRGIAVDRDDPERGYFTLRMGGRAITCRESLSELTTAVALSRCDDKALTRKLLAAADVSVPAQQAAGSDAENQAFLDRYGHVVVKPARGEQGTGVSVDLTTMEEVNDAITEAAKSCDLVLLEQFVSGQDIRIIVINYEVVAAAIRKPAEIVGTGEHSIRKLIDRLSRRRSAATGGESRIPLDDETLRCLKSAGYDPDDVLPKEETIQVRKAANLHTGGTIHDITADLHPELADAAVRAARALTIPVVGFDFLTKDYHNRPDYVVIEANERPGLANHEPAPTAERFVDLLFPTTAKARAGGTPRV